MKKAFEDNLPRVKPRVRFSVPVEGATAPEAASPAETIGEQVDIHAAVHSAAEAALREPSSSNRESAEEIPLPPTPRVPAEEFPLPPAVRCSAELSASGKPSNSMKPSAAR
jgi:hypothetical protein